MESLIVSYEFKEKNPPVTFSHHIIHRPGPDIFKIEKHPSKEGCFSNII
jgi:hypothetical protein